MAERENIRKRIKKLPPQIVAAGDAIEKALVESGCTDMVILTEDMSPGEEEMAFFEKYLKDGQPAETAEQEAKDSVSLMRRVFGY